MNMNIPADVQFAIDRLKEFGHEAYLVGGCVRDTLLGKEPKDYDITTNIDVEEIKRIFRQFRQIKGNFDKHGTVTIILDKKPIEITSYHVGNTINEDLSHRDFTINAMVYSPASRLVIDCVDGQTDLAKGVVRCVGDSRQRLSENGTRILRALRFSSQLGFIIADDTKKAIHELYEKILFDVAVEQIERELGGILTGKNVFYVLSEFRDVISYIFPELKPCLNFVQNNKYHKHQNLYEHIIHVTASTKPDYATRLAALLHDVGKPNCYSEEIDEDGSPHGHFYGHPSVSKKLVEPSLTRLRVCNRIKEEVLYLIEYHDYHFVDNEKNVKKIFSLLPNKNDFDLFLKLVDLRIADRNDHQNLKSEYIPNMDAVVDIAKQLLDKETKFQLKNLEVNGIDVMRFGYVGKDVGKILNHLLNMVSSEKLENNRKELIYYLYQNSNVTVSKQQ